MRESTAQLERNVGIAGDPRWELVERIVASPCFVKSPRLCSFLIYMCDLFLRGRADEINELNIGEALFDRPALIMIPFCRRHCAFLTPAVCDNAWTSTLVKRARRNRFAC